MHRIIILLIGFIMISPIARADTETSHANDVAKITMNNNNSTPDEITVTQAYKMLYENSKESNNRLISTIRWVIGIVVAFLLALIGSQVFFNIRISKREIDNIKKDLDTKSSALKEELLKNINEGNRDNIKQYQAYENKIGNMVKEEIQRRFEEKSKYLETKMTGYEKNIEMIEREMKNDIKYLEIDIRKNEGDLWNLRGVKANALARYVETANLKIELKGTVEHSLDDIIEVLSKMDSIHKMDYSHLESLIKKIPKKHENLKSQIESLFKDKPVYEFVDDPQTGLSQKRYIKK